MFPSGDLGIEGFPLYLLLSGSLSNCWVLSISFLSSYLTGVTNLSGPREFLVTGGVDNDNQGFAEGTGDEDDDDGRGVLEDNPINYVNVVTKLKPARSRRFPWSEDLDRYTDRCSKLMISVLWTTFPLHHG